MVDNPTSRGVKRDFNLDNIRLTESLTSPSIDINNSTSTRSVMPVGNLGVTTQTLPIAVPSKNLVYSDGSKWVQLAVVREPQPIPIPITIAGYAGPGPSKAGVPPGIPLNRMLIPILSAVPTEWFAISDSNAIDLLAGGQDTFVLSSQTPPVSWKLSNFPGSPGGLQFIDELPVGIYNISISGSFNVNEKNVTVILALGIHEISGGKFAVSGLPLYVDLPNLIYNVIGSTNTGDTGTESELTSISAEGMLEVKDPLKNVGLICKVSKPGMTGLSITTINMVVNKVS